MGGIILQVLQKKKLTHGESKSYFQDDKMETQVSLCPTLSCALAFRLCLGIPHCAWARAAARVDKLWLKSNQPILFVDNI